MIYFNVIELAALGGTDYREEMGPSGDLAEDSACNLTLDPTQRELALLLVNKNNADDAGSVPATNTLLAEAIACLSNQPPAMLESMLLTVQCQLGRHAAYPQVNL